MHRWIWSTYVCSLLRISSAATWRIDILLTSRSTTTTTTKALAGLFTTRRAGG